MKTLALASLLCLFALTTAFEMNLSLKAPEKKCSEALEYCLEPSPNLSGSIDSFTARPRYCCRPHLTCIRNRCWPIVPSVQWPYKLAQAPSSTEEDENETFMRYLQAHSQEGSDNEMMYDDLRASSVQGDDGQELLDQLMNGMDSTSTSTNTQDPTGAP